MSADTLGRLSAALADRYRIERELGAGGMATVYLAQDLKHDRQVAIKVLRPELAAVLGADRFVQEIKTTAALQHPHILPLFDSGSADGFLYYVMPYIQGETLRNKLDRDHQLGVDEAVRITTEVADALDYAHRRGVIHRDIKPENILLHDGRPMVADFGIALAVSAAAGGRMTETGLSLGTPHYMSPEQATAEKEITARSDVYSLASVLYEMLTGNPPHTGASAQQIIMKIIAEPVPAVTSLRKSVPPNVAAALTKALEKLPADRFDSARAFAEALADMSFYRKDDPGRRRHIDAPPDRRLVGLAALCALALAAAAWGWLRPSSHSVPSPWRVTLPVPDSAPVRYGLDISDDGSVVVYGSSARMGVLVRRADAAGFAPVPGIQDAYGVSLSPDGRQLAFIRDGSLWVMPVDGGEPAKVVDRLQIYANVKWNGSDGILLSDPDGIIEAHVLGGATRRIATVDSTAREAFMLHPAPIPGGGVVFTIFTPGLGVDSARIGFARGGATDHTVLMPGLIARYAAPDTLLVLQRDGAIVVVPFDARTGRVTGAATPVLRGLHPALLSSEGAFAVSRGGRLVVVTKGAVGGASYNLVRVTRGGTVVPLDTSWSGPFQSVAVSRDGAKVAVGATAERSWEIRVRDLRTRAEVRISGRGVFWQDPSFSPLGDALLVDSLGPNGGGVFRVSLAAAAVLQRLWTPTSGIDPERPRYSADGATIYYSAYDVATGAVSLRARSAASPTKDLETVASGDGEVSPDGRWVAYVSTESGAAGLYVRRRVVGSSERWLVSPGATGVPRWAPGGRELVFSAGDSIYAVPVQGGQTFTAGVRRALVGLRGFRPSFDLFPNGDLLMLRERLGTGGSSLMMMENWRAALRGR